jgi:hypothetical protein
MMCERIRKELIAYRDGELSKQERLRVADHLRGCPACMREERALTRVEHLLTSLPSVTPSAGFNATFWQRLAQESEVEPESRLARWWREWTSSWQLAPALAAAASVVVFLGYLLSSAPTSPTRPFATKPLAMTPSGTVERAPVQAESVPAEIAQEPELFLDYNVLANINKLSYLEEIVALEPPPDVEIDEKDIPHPLVKKLNLFVHYPMLQKIEELEHMEAVLTLPGNEDHSRG